MTHAGDAILQMAMKRAVAYANKHGCSADVAVGWVLKQMFIAPVNEYRLLDMVIDALDAGPG